MKIEKINDILNQSSYGAYIILKLLFKNRQSFIKVFDRIFYYNYFKIIFRV